MINLFKLFHILGKNLKIHVNCTSWVFAKCFRNLGMYHITSLNKRFNPTLKLKHLTSSNCEKDINYATCQHDVIVD